MKNYSVKLNDDFASRLTPLGISTEVRRRCMDYDRMLLFLRDTMPSFTRDELIYIVGKLKDVHYDIESIDAFSPFYISDLLYDKNVPMSRDICAKLHCSKPIGVYVFVMRVRAWYAWASKKHTLGSWLTPSIDSWNE